MDANACAQFGRRTGEGGLDDLGLADQDEFEAAIGVERAQGTGYAFRRTAITTHHIDGDGRHALVLADLRSPRRELFFALDFGRLFDDALAAIKAVRGNAMAQVGLTGLRIDGQRRFAQGIVRTMHTAL
jgi:hypothetical protein